MRSRSLVRSFARVRYVCVNIGFNSEMKRRKKWVRMVVRWPHFLIAAYKSHYSNVESWYFESHNLFSFFFKIKEMPELFHTSIVAQMQHSPDKERDDKLFGLVFFISFVKLKWLSFERERKNKIELKLLWPECTPCTGPMNSYKLCTIDIEIAFKFKTTRKIPSAQKVEEFERGKKSIWGIIT